MWMTLVVIDILYCAFSLYIFQSADMKLVVFYVYFSGAINKNLYHKNAQEIHYFVPIEKTGMRCVWRF